MDVHTDSGEIAATRLSLGEFVLDLKANELFTVQGQLAGLRKQALDEGESPKAEWLADANEHMRRHPSFGAGHVTARFPGEDAAHSELRSRMIGSLRELGMRDQAPTPR